MKKFMITSIDFVFEDGQDKAYTHVNLTFTTIGTKYVLDGEVTVTGNEFETAGANTDSFVDLALSKIVGDFGKELH